MTWIHKLILDAFAKLQFGAALDFEILELSEKIKSLKTANAAAAEIQKETNKLLLLKSEQGVQKTKVVKPKSLTLCALSKAELVWAQEAGFIHHRIKASIEKGCAGEKIFSDDDLSTLYYPTSFLSWQAQGQLSKGPHVDPESILATYKHFRCSKRNNDEHKVPLDEPLPFTKLMSHPGLIRQDSGSRMRLDILGTRSVIFKKKQRQRVAATGRDQGRDMVMTEKEAEISFGPYEHARPTRICI